MKNRHQTAAFNALVLANALFLVTSTGLGQSTEGEAADAAGTAQGGADASFFENNARELIVFDRDGSELQTLGDRDLYAAPVFSPNGTRVAVARNWVLWVFGVDGSAGTRISSGAGYSPVWSPDGTEIAYVNERDSYAGFYRKTSTGEGPEELVYRHPGEPVLTDWSLDGRFLVFHATDLSGGTINLLPLGGDGQAIVVARSEAMILGGRISPDNRFIAYRSNESGRNEIVVRAIGHLTDRPIAGGRPTVSDEAWQVSNDGALGMASWRRDGQELYFLAADRGVMAVEVDTDNGFTMNRPRQLFTAPEGIPQTELSGGMGPIRLDELGNVSRDGQRIVFVVSPPPQRMRITVFDRAGNVESRITAPGFYDRPALSPDGSRVAVSKQDPQTGSKDIWTFDVSTGEGIAVTDDRFPDHSPVWLPDGTRVAFVSTRGIYEGVYSKAWNGEGQEQLLFRNTPGTPMALDAFTGDERFMSISSGDVVLAVPLIGTDPLSREPIEFIREEFEARTGRFSPNGHFLAYVSNESGRNEIYVRRFDLPSRLENAPDDAKWQISSNGGLGMVYWRHDDEELYYLAADGGVMAVEVSMSPTIEFGEPTLLFNSPDRIFLRNSSPSGRGNISTDGQHIVFVVPTTDEASPLQ